MSAREWVLILDRLERAAERGFDGYAQDRVLSDIAAIRAEVTGMEAALEALQKRG